LIRQLFPALTLPTDNIFILDTGGGALLCRPDALPGPNDGRLFPVAMGFVLFVFLLSAFILAMAGRLIVV